MSRPLSTEAEQRRARYESGDLTIDEVCGVRDGDRMCLRPLNCKYHSVAFKRVVPGRTQPFDVLLAAFNAEPKQLAARKAATTSRSHKRKSSAQAAPPVAAGFEQASGGLGGAGVVRREGSGAPGRSFDASAFLRPIDVPDDGWREEWLMAIRELAARTDPETRVPPTLGAFDDLALIAPPLAMGMPMRKKRR